MKVLLPALAIVLLVSGCVVAPDAPAVYGEPAYVAPAPVIVPPPVWWGGGWRGGWHGGWHGGWRHH